MPNETFVFWEVSAGVLSWLKAPDTVLFLISMNTLIDISNIESEARRLKKIKGIAKDASEKAESDLFSAHMRCMSTSTCGGAGRMNSVFVAACAHCEPRKAKYIRAFKRALDLLSPFPDGSSEDPFAIPGSKLQAESKPSSSSASVSESDRPQKRLCFNINSDARKKTVHAIDLDDSDNNIECTCARQTLSRMPR